MRLLLCALILLWLQLYWMLIPTWRFGEYYGYGWFVPFLAAGLVWRRWQMLVPGPHARATGGPGMRPGTHLSRSECNSNEIGLASQAPASSPPPAIPAPPLRLAGWVVALGLLAMLAILPLQWIATADPSWRPPLLLLALLTFGLTHFLVWQVFGRRVSLGLLTVTVFALSAVPYPWQLEQHLIRSLTGAVVGLSREAFLLTGQPVELLGERLVIGSESVDVTDGCSGIRSFQSLTMGALFFGELLLLSLPKRLVLVTLAAACSIGINTARAYALAVIHFNQGKAAAAAAHDLVGNVAYWVSTAIVFLVALCLVRSTPAGRRVVRNSQIATTQKIKAEN
jgi:exosortase